MEVKLLRGEICLIDDEDLPLLNGRRWRASYHTAHPRRVARVCSGAHRTYMALHNLLMSPPKGMVVDHINGDPLDNRRSNLRLATYRDNSRNRRIRKETRSNLKGVDFHPSGSCKKPWRARIRIDGKEKMLGYFATKEEAYAVRLAVSREYHGAFFAK